MRETQKRVNKIVLNTQVNALRQADSAEAAARSAVRPEVINLDAVFHFHDGRLT
jgi:hypothetical protein